MILCQWILRTIKWYLLRGNKKQLKPTQYDYKWFLFWKTGPRALLWSWLDYFELLWPSFMFCCFSFCSILNICETLVCRPLAVFWAECSSSGECQYIQSRLPVNRETFSISSRKIWQRGALSLWAELRNSNFAPLPHLFPSLPPRGVVSRTEPAEWSTFWIPGRRRRWKVEGILKEKVLALELSAWTSSTVTKGCGESAGSFLLRKFYKGKESRNLNGWAVGTLHEMCFRSLI